MKHTFLYSLVLSVSFLSACDVSTGTVNSGSSAGDQASYNEYVANRNDAISVLDELDTTTALAEAPENSTASLQGTYAINSTESFGTALVGDMTMNVDFDTATVSGSLTNNFLDEDGTDESNVTELDGSVNFTGSLDLDPTGGFYDSTNTDQWQLEASGAGTLTDNETAASGGATYRLDVDLYGNFYDTSGIGDVDGVGELGDVAAGGLIEGNVDVTTDGDTVIYDITGSELYGTGDDSSGFLVYELED
ncbi:hypothetical protein [Pacificibacter marinus]|uniref:hypothetical protein n=1 Tax=Pacificibacter marinus TaxID=658057 RepID=UPI001C06EAC2|nr:hypothetical protein [Pacificibacter marinus]MBU2869047.1 hypothetical protein [Pacificibacter marinus]